MSCQPRWAVCSDYGEWLSVAYDDAGLEYARLTSGLISAYHPALLGAVLAQVQVLRWSPFGLLYKGPTIWSSTFVIDTQII